MAVKVETFSIAQSGTTSNGLTGGGSSRLRGLLLPALDSTTIEFEASFDGGTTYVSIYTNSGTPAAVTLGTASTGSRVQAVPEEVGRISAVAKVRLKVAAQTTAARTIKSVWE